MATGDFNTASVFGGGILGGMNYTTTDTEWRVASGVQAIANPYSRPNQPETTHCKGCGAASFEVHRSDCEKLKDRCFARMAKASKHHSVVELLRMEIQSWHGDILERRAA